MTKKLFKVLMTAILGAMLFNFAWFLVSLLLGGELFLLPAQIIGQAISGQQGKLLSPFLVNGLFGAFVFSVFTAFRQFSRKDNSKGAE